MEIGRLPISASQRGKLLSAGYTTLSSLSSISPSQLAQDIKISEAEAAEILKLVSPSIRLEKSDKSPAVINGALSAWDMLHEEDMFNRITTSCADLDEILGGGISCKEVTEIGGVPGIGKTQLGIQLAVNVQIPIEYGGLGGKAIYIDTEGSFMVERALQVSEGCVDDMLNNNSYRQTYFQASEPKLQPKHFLQNIYYFRVCSYTEQIALTNYLEKFISEHKDVKIVIIDSITFHFRQDFENLALRTRVLGEMALKLMKLAKNFNLAFLSASNISRTKVATEQHWFWGRLVFVKPKIVLLNQVTTKYTDGSFQLTLALGDSWSHSSTNRIILYWNGNDRCAYIDKSPSLRSASASYSVTQKGIRACSSIYKRVKMM